MRKIIKRDQSQVQEYDCFGLTALHYASDWPEGLEILLICSRSQSNTCSHHLEPWHPFVHACAYHNEACLKSFLHNGCQLSFPDYTHFHEALCYGSARQRELLITELARRRTELLSQACSAGMPAPDSFSVNGSILDAKANDVVAWLQKRGISVESSLCPPLFGKTVFHPTGRKFFNLPLEIFEELYAAGFCDIDAFDDDGTTPFSRTIRDSGIWPEPDYLAWLCTKGADVKREHYCCQSCGSTLHKRLLDWLAEGVGVLISKVYLFVIKQSGFAGLASRMEPISMATKVRCYFSGASNKLVHLVLADDSADQCLCACSTEGCSTIHQLYMGFQNETRAFSHSRNHSEGRSRLSFFRKLVIAVMELAAWHNIDEKVKARLSHHLLRMCTFDALGLTHTCCASHGFYPRRHASAAWKDRDEVVEIVEEESVLIGKLEEVTRELESQLHGHNVSFAEFMEDYWEPMMDKELQVELETTIDEDEVKQVEAIGVIVERPARHT